MMLNSLKTIVGFQITGAEVLGEVEDLLIDDQSWNVRYVVVDTGGWLTSREVVLSPESFSQPRMVEKKIVTELTRKQIEESPVISKGNPPTAEEEEQLALHYYWTPYWQPNLGADTRSMETTSVVESAPHHTSAEPGRTHRLIRMSDLARATLRADAASIGSVRDAYAVTEKAPWSVKALAVSVSGDHLLPTTALAGWDAEEKAVDTTWSKEQVERQPSAEDKPSIPASQVDESP